MFDVCKLGLLWWLPAARTKHASAMPRLCLVCASDGPRFRLVGCAPLVPRLCLELLCLRHAWIVIRVHLRCATVLPRMCPVCAPDVPRFRLVGCAPYVPRLCFETLCLRHAWIVIRVRLRCATVLPRMCSGCATDVPRNKWGTMHLGFWVASNQVLAHGGAERRRLNGSDAAIFLFIPQKCDKFAVSAKETINMPHISSGHHMGLSASIFALSVS